MESKMPDLLARLIAIQGAHKWSDAEMSARMQVTRVLWQQVKKGDRRFGTKTLRAILVGFPELGPEVLTYLAPDPKEPAAA